MANCKTWWIFVAVPYTGNDPLASAPSVNLVAKIVKQWYQDLWKAGRNITADNVFPDFKLADDLLKNCTTYFGTVRKSKKLYQLNLFLKNMLRILQCLVFMKTRY